MTENTSLKEKWDLVTKKLSIQFADGDTLNLDPIIYLIGVQKLGQGKGKLNAHCYLQIIRALWLL
jgi:hypothetical protein